MKGAPSSSFARLRDEEFREWSRLVREETGIHLPLEKRELLIGRLTRCMRRVGVSSFSAYLERVRRDLGERHRMIDAVTTNETHFFREPIRREFVADVVARWHRDANAGRRRRLIRAWSAACSTGEEPYSLAMTLKAALPLGSPLEVDVLATDLSERVLEVAERGEYPIARLEEIPEAFRKAYMLRGVGAREGTMKVSPEIRNVVRFSRVNLVRPPLPVQDGFDLILCRNVLIYFDQPTKRAVVERLLDKLSPGGYFVSGRSESLHGITGRVRSVSTAVYVDAGRMP